MSIKTALPAAELGLYSLVLSGALAYAGRGLLEASQDGAHRKAFRESVRPGWEYIGRKMDVADFEWVMWFTSFRNIIVFALSGHVLFAKLCTMVAPQLRSWMYAVYGALAVLGTMGPWYLGLLLGHCVSLYVASLLGQPWLCLGLGLASLASFKLDPLISWQTGFVTGTFDLQEVLFHGGSGFTVLRCTSFALESCAHPDRRYSLADLLKYNFYLPFFFFGPIMTFDRFHAQMSQVEPVRREGELWRIRAQGGLSVVAIMAVDIFFHFFYILTIPSDLKFANRLPESALAGLAYSNLVYDWVKAAVLFGVVNTVARLDHLDPPQPPKCITALYVFAETHFDRGINDWLCKYVYDHIGGEHSEVIPELGATVATFAITTLWLGPCDIVYLWSFLNCFGLNFELWVQKLAEWGPLAQIEVSREGLGQGLAGSLEGMHCCSLESSSHTWPPVRNFLTTTSWLSGQWLPLWVSSTPFCGVWTPGPGCDGQALPSLWSSVFPSLTTREGCPGDSQRPEHIPRTWGSPVGRTSDQLCPLSP
ncbi:protein-cysteine N-palmitoyltransferase HHAT-like protein isoform X1 [Phoca vitulina]|uniref:protein-cysteine N-palmitoyltransferase HHAT-like protein isoform X1 n=1 Tax=Phoca vitulina TaxID=9720 RepID=UPI001395D484|nr:protein-cysteine N-palmitoyltransferase HHAT-like protein isoform X1 [Phoca vitulina]XP_032264765.1 protein-cysteine N-palmitoyltransferase HHAT-like protein isoform X1 [Phoca vitulina]